jgi:apolipoprotein N-acyltransferase
MGSLMDEIHTPLLFGAYSWRGGEEFNSALLLRPPFELVSVYRKNRPLPLAERKLGSGQGPVVMTVQGVKLSPQICYEGIFSEFTRQQMQLGADALVNLSNDAWFGRTTEPALHLRLTVFRAIELRRPIVRSTNSGISAVVDRTGRIRASTELLAPAILHYRLPFPGPGEEESAATETFFQRHGELFSELCVALSICGACVMAIRTLLRNRSCSRRGA